MKLSGLAVAVRNTFVFSTGEGLSAVSINSECQVFRRSVLQNVMVLDFLLWDSVVVGLSGPEPAKAAPSAFNLLLARAVRAVRRRFLLADGMISSFFPPH